MEASKGKDAVTPIRHTLRDRIFVVVLAMILLIVRFDTFPRTPATVVASEYLFSILHWEATTLLSKWPHLLLDAIPGRRPPRSERLAVVDEYLQLARLVDKEEDRLEGRFLTRGSVTASGSAKEATSVSREYLEEITAEKEALRARAEETIEAELSAVLYETGLDSRFGVLFPPVDLRFAKPPTVMVTSPRDRIERLETTLLLPEIPVLERAALETEVQERFGVVGLVDNLAGLGTYPPMVSDLHPLRTVLQTGAHEWLHNYFFFRPLGRKFWSSQEMATINETAADLAGRELGDVAFARMGGDLTESASRYLSAEERDPVFTREMRETRLRVDELLGEGNVEEAEEYMKQRWWRLRLAGYGIRKINQAYFAFRGTYARQPCVGEPNKRTDAGDSTAVS